MASFKQFGRLFRGNNAFKQASRSVHSGPGAASTGRRAVVLGSLAAIGAGTGLYAYHNMDAFKQSKISPVQVAHAAAVPESQPSVWSQGKQHALYLWIHLKPEADNKKCAKAVAGLQKMVDKVTPSGERDDENEIWAGVGFGPNFFAQATGRHTNKNYNYPHRKGANGEMPSTGGDIFIHAKSEEPTRLFQLAQEVMAALPEDSVEKFEDIYSFVFRNGRDLSGFIDGTENAAADEDRQEVAVEKQTGGSYVITQKWIHDMNLIRKEKDSNMEKWVGRSRADSIELPRKAVTSHVARMTGGNKFQNQKPFQIVRQSMPFGTLSGDAGLFFIGYAESPENFEFMLDNMVGAGKDGPHCDDVMRLSKCVTGTYWYFPGVKELNQMA